MDNRSILDLIERRLADLQMTEHEAERLSGHPDAIRNIRRAIEKGKGSPAMGTLTDLAKVLQIAPAAFMSGNGVEPDAYTAAIAKLRARIEELERAIRVLEEERIAAKKPAD